MGDVFEGYMGENKTPITDEKLARVRVNAQVTIGLNFMGAGRFEEALKGFDRALADDPNELRALMGRAVVLARLSRFDAALEAAAEVISRDPESGRAYDTSGAIYQMMGKWREAEVAFEKAIALEPHNAAHYYNYACYWARRLDADRCRENLAEALRLNPASNVFAATDVDFALYRDDQWFQDLVAFK
jgi:tetratricopeptide (TPR) repeat protein